MSVPALRGPVQQSPGTPQKTISQLLTQWADLTNAAIAATGETEIWYRSPIIKKKPWDPAAADVGLSPCGTVGSKRAHQVQASVQHDPFQHDPRPISDKLTAYWESQGFTVTRTIDWTTLKGRQSVELRADRADGVQVGLTATNDLVTIDVATECSVHPSIDDWALARSLRDLNAPTPTPSVSAGDGGADTVNLAASAAVIDPTDPFSQFRERPAADPSDLFREFREDASADPSQTRPEASADDDGWVW